MVATYFGDSNFYGGITAQIPQNVVNFAISRRRREISGECTTAGSDGHYVNAVVLGLRFSPYTASHRCVAFRARTLSGAGGRGGDGQLR